MGINIKTIFNMFRADEKEIPNLDMDEMCKIISERTGIDYLVVMKVLDAEEEYLIEQNIATKNI